MADFNIKTRIELILKRMDDAYSLRPKVIRASKPRLVAVSKKKPADMIIDAYAAGQRHFGENYVEELIEKSRHPDILAKCPNIKWHFIGHLQNNKVNKIIKVPNLYMVQTVDSEKLANNLNSVWGKLEIENKIPLKILIQVNTSDEEAKHGVKLYEAPALFKHIRRNLSNLQMDGIMTIGAFGHDYSIKPNPDFNELMIVHRKICEQNALLPDEMEVSMGMSNDFDKAANTLQLDDMTNCVHKFLCIPATSVESERLFSKAGQLISKRRAALKEKHVDMLLFLNKNQWLSK